MTDTALQTINERFPLTKRDPGEYAAFSASPLKVKLSWYEAAGLGNVSVLHGTAMLGLMRMDTLVVDPFLRDMPLFSYDYIAAMGNHTWLVEYYDTLLDPAAFDASAFAAVKASVAALPEHDLGAHWYDHLKLACSMAKKTRKQALPALNTAFLSALGAYLDMAAKQPPLSTNAAEEKRKKAAAYVDGLLTNGGPSTDAFRKAIGEARTRDLFRRIVFGTEA